ncbi:Abi family protein [Fructilactobacillus cliffordii]|uniref:Abi family protein n=1 Tax=Fructilactobacillus cliffordii TaxID=2940299 RepID=UPI002091E759|nr:Abi family protein [Fructilactobacillus cliffordii]USS86118.1 Abi family protein [Fructilactobacillus cliffordii]
MTIKGKTTNGLMKHIRDNHKITINGSKEKKELLEMGYFHGYKAYRLGLENYISNFSQIEAIYNFDMRLKSSLYTHVIKYETLIKNITLSCIASSPDGGVSLKDVMKNKLNGYNDISNSNKRKKKIKSKLKLKAILEELVMENYNKPYVNHYVDSSNPLPLWAYFELMTMGSFGIFINLLNVETKIKISKSLKTYDYQLDPNCKTLSNDIFLIKDLRNCIAHNSPIFDVRFKNNNPSNLQCNKLVNYFNLSVNIKFDSIIDYFLLIVFYFNSFNGNKTESRKIIKEATIVCNDFKNSINNNSLLFKIIGSDYQTKLNEALTSI